MWDLIGALFGGFAISRYRRRQFEAQLISDRRAMEAQAQPAADEAYANGYAQAAAEFREGNPAVQLPVVSQPQAALAAELAAEADVLPGDPFAGPQFVVPHTAPPARSIQKPGLPGPWGGVSRKEPRQAKGATR